MMPSIPDNSRPVVEIKELRLFFQNGAHKEDVLRGIDLSLYPGETLGIVGESGSGKSLTALALGGLLPPLAEVSCTKFSWFLQNGEILDLQDWRQAKFAPLRGKEIAYIFQDPGTCLNPVLSCGEQVAEAIRQHGRVKNQEARRQALAWLERVMLPEPERIFRAFPHELSGGQKQRVMIAAALCTRPRLLVADEPTTALDTTVQRHILDLIKSLKRELGLTALFISHDLDIIGEMADRVVVLHEGKIAEENSVAGLFQAPKHPYTRTLLDCRPSMRSQVERLPVSPLPESQEVGPSVHVKVGKIKSETPLLHVEGLSVGYRLRPAGIFKRAGRLQALDKVGFRLHAGETLGIVGESGSGKSTLARVLLGLIPPEEGKILYQEKQLLGADRAEWQKLRKELQIVFQDPFSTLNPRQRVEEALLEPLLVHRYAKDIQVCKERVNGILEKVGLSKKFLHRFPHELSGGQRQRVSIARALVLDPKVLVCDEAVSALDVTVQAMVLNLLKDLQAELGIAYLFISHDLAAVAFMSERIIVMQEGKIVETGITKEILSNPQNTYTRALLAAVPRPH